MLKINKMTKGKYRQIIIEDKQTTPYAKQKNMKTDIQYDTSVRYAISNGRDKGSSKNTHFSMHI